jgi:hypothetical protein
LNPDSTQLPIVVPELDHLDRLDQLLISLQHCVLNHLRMFHLPHQLLILDSEQNHWVTIHPHPDHLVILYPNPAHLVSHNSNKYKLVITNSDLVQLLRLDLDPDQTVRLNPHTTHL